MAIKFKEITKRAEDLIEQGREAEDNVQSCQARVSAASSQVRAAQRAVDDAMETDSEGNPRGDVDAAQARLQMAQGQLAASRRALASAQEQVVRVDSEKSHHVQTIERHNQVGQDNLRKVRSLSGNAFSADLAPLAADMVSRLNMAEEAKVRLLRSMGIEATADLVSVPDFGEENSYAGRGGNFATLDTTGTLSAAGGGAGGSEGAVSGWSGLGDSAQGDAILALGSQAATLGVALPANAGIGLMAEGQQEQLAASREQYAQESGGCWLLMNSIIFDEGLSIAEKKEALNSLREELLRLQDGYLNQEQVILAAQAEGAGHSLKRDLTEQLLIGTKAIDETIANYRESLSKRGVPDGMAMDDFLNRERNLMLEELSANIGGDLSKVHEVPNLDEVATTLRPLVTASSAEAVRSYSDQWARSLSQGEISAISDYTGEFPPYYKNINAVLRRQEPTFGPGNEERSHLIHEALSKAKLPVATKVYRGISAEALNELNFSSDNELVGDVYLDRGFISTSLSPMAAFKNDVLLELDLPAGCPAASIEGISKMGGSEQEVLIDCGQLFRITDVRRKGDQRIISAEYWGGVTYE